MTWAARSCASSRFRTDDRHQLRAVQDRFTGFPVYIPLVQVKPGTIAAFYNARRVPAYTRPTRRRALIRPLAGSTRQLRLARVRICWVIDYRQGDSLELKLLTGQASVRDDFLTM